MELGPEDVPIKEVSSFQRVLHVHFVPPFLLWLSCPETCQQDLESTLPLSLSRTCLSFPSSLQPVALTLPKQ